MARPGNFLREKARAVTVVAFVLVAGALLLGPARVAPSVAPNGATQLAFAAASVDAPDGPAGGAHVTCQAAGSTSIGCTTATSAALPLSGGPSWANITAKVVPLPAPRFTVMVWDGSDGYVLAYGGVESAANGSGYEVRDTWSYLNGVWSNLTTLVSGGPPPNVINPAITYDPWTKEVVLFGGTTATSDNLSLTWTYHDLTWTNITATAGVPPSPRWAPVFTPDLASSQMILYGGNDPGNDGPYTATWLFTGTQWSNITGTVGVSPPPLQGCVGVYDAAESGILMFGTNLHGPPYVGNTFVFRGGAWVNLTAGLTTPPPIMDFPAIGYYAATSTVVVVASIEFDPGTGAGDFSAAAWTFANGQWTNVTADGLVPGSGALAAVATDPTGALLMFGGAYGENATVSQWMYAYSAGPSAVSLSATPSALDVGNTSNLTVASTGGLSPFTFAFTQNGAPTSENQAWYDFSPTAAGTYTFQVTVTDFLGRSGSASATVTVNARPSGATIAVNPSSPTAGSAAELTATFSGGTSPISAAWEFGDGTTGSGISASHSFAHTGSYQVNLTLTDADAQRATATLLVNVTSSSSGVAPLSGALLIALAIGVVVVVAAVAALLLMRRRRAPPTSTGTSPAMSAGVAPPPSAPAPPPGASGGSPPPPPPG